MFLKQPPDNPLSSHGPPADSNPVIVLSRSPTLDTVLLYLSPGDVARLQCTCKIISVAVIDWKRAAYNVNRFLERFFKDPVTFRVLQAQTNLLISGSAALQFMDRIFYEDSDLDLYVSSSRAREVVMFLRTQNYEFFPGDRAGVSTNLESLLTDLETEGNKHFETDGLPMHYSGRGYHGTTIHGVLYFRHRENAALVVQIIAIYNYLPLICSLMWFHSTVVLNYITWNKAVSLYPCATFERRRSLILTENLSFAVAQAKYLARGFTFQDTLTPDEAKSPGPFQAGPRYVGDKRTWILNLETESIPSTSVPASRRVYDPETIHSWDLTNLRYSDQLNTTPPLNTRIGSTAYNHIPIIYFSLLMSENLEHKYVVHREFHRLASEMCLGSSQTGATSSTISPPRGDAVSSKLDEKLIECLALFATWVNEVRSKMAAHPDHEYCWWKL